MKKPENNITINGIVLTDEMQQYIKEMQQQGLASIMVEYCEKTIDHFLDDNFFCSDEQKVLAYNHILNIKYMKTILQAFDLDTTTSEIK